MNRRGDEHFIRDLLNKIRNKIPEAIIRTTYIVGFPNETEADFIKLYNFTEEFEFDRLGVFAYSKEEDTPAYNFKDNVKAEVKLERLEKIMKLQKKIVKKKNKLEIGKTHHTLVEYYDPETAFYYGRSYAFAPDDIDGMIAFQSEEDLEIGDFVPVKISATYGYDLIGDKITGGK
jgi:ribosomal protein S12 methylthiotransferase